MGVLFWDRFWDFSDNNDLIWRILFVSEKANSYK